MPAAVYGGFNVVLNLVTAQLFRRWCPTFSELIAQARDTIAAAAARLVHGASLVTSGASAVDVGFAPVFDSIEATDAEVGADSVHVLASSTEAVAVAVAARTICAALAEPATAIYTGLIAIFGAAMARETHVTDALVATAIGVFGAHLAIAARLSNHSTCCTATVDVSLGIVTLVVAAQIAWVGLRAYIHT